MLTEAWISSNWRKIMKKNWKSLCENVIEGADGCVRTRGASIGDNSTRKTNYTVWLAHIWKTCMMIFVLLLVLLFSPFFLFKTCVVFLSACVCVCTLNVLTSANHCMLAHAPTTDKSDCFCCVVCFFCVFFMFCLFLNASFFSGRPVAKW